MHMTWVRYVCGRIKSDFRYSNEVVTIIFRGQTEFQNEKEMLLKQPLKKSLTLEKNMKTKEAHLPTCMTLQ